MYSKRAIKKYQLIRLSEVSEITSIPISSIYEKIRAGLFPKPVKLGARAIAWPIYEISIMNRAMISGKTPTELKRVISKLEIRRAKCMERL